MGSAQATSWPFLLICPWPGLARVGLTGQGWDGWGRAGEDTLLPGAPPVRHAEETAGVEH